MKFFQVIKDRHHRWPYLRKALGVGLIVIGLLALFTPLTPGSWLVVIGLQLVGIRLLLVSKLSKLFKRK